MNQAKEAFLLIIGAIGSAIANAFGGWDAALTTLVIFMVIDYVTGIIVAACFQKSNKSKSGSLSSAAGWKGLCKKGVTLLVVLVAYRLDLLLGVTYIKDFVVISFVANEGLSILENCGSMGIPMPAVLTKAIEVLQKKSDDEEEKK